MRKSRKPKENFEGVSIKDSNFLSTEYHISDDILNAIYIYFNEVIRSGLYRGSLI